MASEGVPPSIQHACLPIDNVRVFFPFQPYDTQLEYIKGVIQALTKKQNAVLESPTGTGKTLSLLCSSLAWQQSGQPGTKSIIYYTSRTHLQLSQAAKEMKKTAYSKVPAVVIGSRAKMCLNADVRRVGDNLINRACRNAKAKNACSYYTNYEQKLEVLNHDAVHDIEDLCNWGESSRCCPYYAAKKIAETKASLVFMPYNYLLDNSIRKGLQLRLENSVVIFDEAHNIESSLKDSVSGFFSLVCMKNVQESCLKLPAQLHDALNREKHGLSRTGYDPKDRSSEIVDEFATKKSSGKQAKEPKVNPIEELSTKLTNDKLQQVNQCTIALMTQIKNLELDKPATIEKVIHVMKEAGIHYSTSDTIITTLDSMASFWSMAGVMNPTVVARYVESATRLCNIVTLLYPTQCLSVARQQNNEKMLKQYYTAYLKGIYTPSPILQKGDLKDWELHLWCLHPAIGLKSIIDSNCITGPRSLIITSGTLAPMHTLANDLEIPIPIERELKHVIGPSQMKIMRIERSPPPQSYSLISDYKNVTKKDYSIALGKTLLPLIQVLPFGTLVFFTSYTNMERAITVWKSWGNIWRDMTSVSEIFVENNKQDQFNNDVVNFKRFVDSSTTKRRKAVFFGVYRGKLSEGINFTGNQCRSVILTGLPFPNVTDPKVEATKLYHEKRGGIGKNWYKQQMLRALNQSLGRVIRTKDDFGLLFFVDARFLQWQYALSRWAIEFFPSAETTMDKVEQEVKSFFESHGITVTGSISENCGAFDIGISAARPALNRSTGLSSSSSLNPATTSLNHPVRIEKTVNNQSNNVSRDRRADMLKNYVVSTSKYYEAQEKLRKAQQSHDNSDEPNSKRSKLSSISDVFNIVCPSNDGPIEVIDILDDEPPQNTQNAPSSTNCDTTPSIATNELQSDKPPEPSAPPPKQKKNNPFAKHKPNPPKPKPPPPPQDPKEHVCSICHWPIAVKKDKIPWRLNCDCEMTACSDCAEHRHQKQCAHCKKTFNRKRYEKILFAPG